MINEAFDGVESFRADNLINTFKLIIDFFEQDLLEHTK